MTEPKRRKETAGIPERLNAKQGDGTRAAELCPDQWLCANGVLDEAAEIQLIVRIPIGHHWVVWAYRNTLYHHVLVVGGEAVESVHGLEVDCVIHHHRVVHPRCS